VIVNPKLFVDACVARPTSFKVLDHYKQVYPSLRVEHLTDKFRQSRCDSVWIKTLASEGGWIVITADRGKDKSKPSLPRLCEEYGITCVTMTKSVAEKGSGTHLEVLHEVLRNAEPIYRTPPGTIISLGMESGEIIRFAFRINRPKKPQISLAAFLASLSN
jgi:hypothetical protein